MVYLTSCTYRHEGRTLPGFAITKHGLPRRLFSETGEEVDGEFCRPTNYLRIPIAKAPMHTIRKILAKL